MSIGEVRSLHSPRRSTLFAGRRRLRRWRVLAALEARVEELPADG